MAGCVAGAVLALSLLASHAEAQGQMGAMAGHQGMSQQGMSTAMMTQMQTMMQRTDLMVQRTQQMTQFAQTMPMSAPGVHAMHMMTENLSAMSVQMKGLTTQMHDLMAVADAGLIMPPKSTWFEPKLADGMVNHVLD